MINKSFAIPCLPLLRPASAIHDFILDFCDIKSYRFHIEGPVWLLISLL